MVTKKEIAQISSIITQPEFAAKFDSGTLRIMREVDTVDMDRLVMNNAMKLNNKQAI